MKYTYKYLIVFMVLLFVGCEDFLDRPPLTSFNDETAWTSEDNVRLYANKYYDTFFTGYGQGWTVTGAPVEGFQFSDDILHLGNQPNFTRSVPNSSIWSYTLIRSLNIMIDRVENRMEGVLADETRNHWLGIGRFFRGWRYADLATQFGDIPYYDYVVSDTDLDDLYKQRTPRNDVMDAVYDDLKFAMDHVRLSDGDQTVNKYVVAGFITRLALREGSWQKYYYKDNTRAKKFFELAQTAGDFVANSGKYDIVTDFRSLFTSLDLKGNRDVILYRHYDPAVGVLHSIASRNNLDESTAYGGNTDLIKSFILNNGEAWAESSMPEAKDFTLANVIKTRDSRFEATFNHKPRPNNRGTFLYINKFIPREAINFIEAGNAVPTEWTGTNNANDYPVMRYAEVLLNWIEAKAELATIGGSAVSQIDIDNSINKIRNRPLAQQAIDRGVQKTAPLDLANLPNDPERDTDVPALLWEIRRERRMEFAFEYSREQDLRRWHKLDYMDTDAHADLLSGTWVNFKDELPGSLNAGNKGVISVMKLDGTQVIYDGNNDSQMNGFFRSINSAGRQPFLNQVNVNPYLTPVGKNQIDDYAAKGYELKQTEGWPQN